MSRKLKPMHEYLTAYGEWLIKHHPGPRYLAADAVAANLKLWAAEYGKEVADRVRGALAPVFKARKWA